MERYIRGKVLYKSDQNGVEVVEAVDPTTTSSQVVLKIISVARLEESDPIFQEAILQRGLTHPRICTVEALFIRQEQRSFKVMVVLEKLERDVAADAKMKKDSNSAYTEKEIFEFVEQKISHRDIKPANVLVTVEGTYKISDFGSAKLNEGFKQDHTIVGTPLYLSPQLLEGFMNAMSIGIAGNVRYDPYKSDVYSLGLTILYLAKLGPSTELSGLQNLEWKLENAIQGIGYSESLKQLLRGMLRIHEHERSDIEIVHQNAVSYLQPQMYYQAEPTSVQEGPNPVMLQPQVRYQTSPQTGFQSVPQYNGQIAASQYAMGYSEVQVYSHYPQVQANQQFPNPAAARDSPPMIYPTPYGALPSNQPYQTQVQPPLNGPNSRGSGVQKPKPFSLPNTRKNHKPEMCVGCSGKISNFLISIPLPCSQDHRFCTAICFRRFINTKGNTCPICNYQFDLTKYQFD